MPPSMLDVLITTPGSPDAIMRGTNDSMPLATPKTLTEKHQAQSLGSCSQGRPPPPEVTPALLKSRWQAPSLGEHVLRQRLDRGRRRDVRDDAADACRASASSLTAAWSTGSSTSAMTTRAPSSSSDSVMPRPMPAAPPVTTATLPFRSSNACPPFLTPRQLPTITPGGRRFRPENRDAEAHHTNLSIPCVS